MALPALLKPPLILTADQMAAADAHTINNLKVPGEVLMERAGESVLDQILARRPQLKKIVILAGKGNNGGDGFVVARKAKERGLDTAVILFAEQSSIKGDAKLKLDACISKKVKFLDVSNIEDALTEVQCIVDALYGIKFRGSLSDTESRAAKFANELRNRKGIFVASVDIPSGVISDTGQVNGESFNCDLTVTFQAFKRAHFCFPGAKLSGERVVVDIGISTEEFQKVRLITPSLFCDELKISSSGHKGVRGHLSVVAGSHGHSGAAILTSRAGLRAGAGLVTLYSDEETRKIAVEVTPEIMTAGTSDEEIRQISANKKGSLVIGPGLGESFPNFNLVLQSASRLPKVIDASAIRILAKGVEPALLNNAILTPHPGEMSSLLGCTIEMVNQDRFSVVLAAAHRMNCMVLLKGAYSLIGFPEGKVLVSPFANANLGTAGSGDVLSGLIGGLLARGINLETASSLAVYLHGFIGSNLLPEGVIGSLASEFADRFPEALSNLLTGIAPNWQTLPATF